MKRGISLFLLLSCREQESRVTPPRGQEIPLNNTKDSKIAPFPKLKLCFYTAAEMLPLEGEIILEFYSFTVSLNAGI